MNLKRNLVIIAAVLLLVCGFFLPNAVVSVTDSRRLGNITMIDSQSVVHESTPTLSLPERLALAANKEAELIGWISGNVMDEVDAERKAILELNRFLRNTQFEFDFRAYTTQESTAIFIIDPEFPTVNMVVWELTIVDKEENTAIITIDDETGAILRIIFRQEHRIQHEESAGDSPANLTEEELRANASMLVETMAEYYGLQIELADFATGRNQAYYRADVAEPGRYVRMFGVVREAGFTMNERAR